MSRLSLQIDALRPRADALAERSGGWAAEATSAVRPLSRPLGRWWRTVSPLGRTVAAVGVIAWFAGWKLGWQELMVVAGACLVLLVATGLFMLGRAVVSVEVRLEPPRVVAGDSSAGQVTVTNTSQRRTLPCQIELPVGDGTAVYDVGALALGASTEELFVIPTERRGVIQVGPATSVRGDPLGLFHREVASSAAHELIVHPHTVPLSSFGSGLLRDLEGVTTKDLSLSDLAFHALREYAPGDDKRHVHWRSSARAGRILVRQFLDTRRSTLCVVADGQPSGYSDVEQFELGLQIAGSIAMRACRDGLPGVVVAGNQAARGTLPHVLLDALSRAEMGPSIADLATLVSRAVSRQADIGVAVLVSGSERSVAEMQRAAARFSPSVQVVAIRILPGEPAGIQARGRATVVSLSELSDLSPLLRMEMTA
jgi:uncharacterized protein (DUF58 family)